MCAVSLLVTHLQMFFFSHCSLTMHAHSPTNISVFLQETYDTIPGQNKITFLLQAIRDASAAEEVCTSTHF